MKRSNKRQRENDNDMNQQVKITRLETLANVAIMHEHHIVVKFFIAFSRLIHELHGLIHSHISHNITELSSLLDTVKTCVERIVSDAELFQSLNYDDEMVLKTIICNGKNVIATIDVIRSEDLEETHQTIIITLDGIIATYSRWTCNKFIKFAVKHHLNMLALGLRNGFSIMIHEAIENRKNSRAGICLVKLRALCVSQHRRGLIELHDGGNV